MVDFPASHVIFCFLGGNAWWMVPHLESGTTNCFKNRCVAPGLQTGNLWQIRLGCQYNSRWNTKRSEKKVCKLKIPGFWGFNLKERKQTWPKFMASCRSVSYFWINPKRSLASNWSRNGRQWFSLQDHLFFLFITQETSSFTGRNCAKVNLNLHLVKMNVTDKQDLLETTILKILKSFHTQEIIHRRIWYPLMSHIQECHLIWSNLGITRPPEFNFGSKRVSNISFDMYLYQNSTDIFIWKLYIYTVYLYFSIWNQTHGTVPLFFRLPNFSSQDLENTVLSRFSQAEKLVPSSFLSCFEGSLLSTNPNTLL